MPFLEHIRNKIVDADFFTKYGEELHRGRVVFTNGCFDILHSGHVTYLAQARQMGDLLVVGLNSDASVRRLKGQERPVNSQDARALVLAALEIVDYVAIFDEDTPYNLIAKVQPDVLVKGGDYQVDNIVGADIVRARGGKVLTVPLVPGFSTTSIIDKINS
ncbi:MAG: D-glycero-beta-D-manno-heptose 1-phosphate adenylyltransferase [Bacteroidales bacterium]|nr:D-glycero-beta-D-manno-heptose 1-phosphate adenylyltransferase [Bacteroidales bacterium]